MVLDVLLRLTDSDYPFSIFKLFLSRNGKYLFNLTYVRISCPSRAAGFNTCCCLVFGFFFSVFFSYFSGIRAAHLFSFCVVFSLCVLCAQCYKCLGYPFLVLYFKIDIKSILFRSFLKLKTKTWIFIKLTCGSEKNKFQ
jgi:hypothetical protein